MAEESSSRQDRSEAAGSEPISYVKEAFNLQYNWITLAGAAAFSLASLSPLPLMLAAGLELIYLSTVPHNGRFQRLVRSWKYAEEKRQHEVKLSALYHELPPEVRTRYADLDKMCRTISLNYARLSSASRIFVSQLEDRLQGLLHAYLRLLHAGHQHREYLRLTDPGLIKREMSQLERTLDSETPKVQEINRKRIEILGKRLGKFEKIRENRQVIDAQCAALEDVLELIRDQSVTMRDPQQVSSQLESLVQDVEQTEETVRQVEAIYEMTAPEMAGTLGLTADSSASAAGHSARTRARN